MSPLNFHKNKKKSQQILSQKIHAQKKKKSVQKNKIKMLLPSFSFSVLSTITLCDIVLEFSWLCLVVCQVLVSLGSLGFGFVNHSDSDLLSVTGFP